MKCCNLASLDDTHSRRGVSGLRGCSALDREIWSEFAANPEALASEASSALTNGLGVSVTSDSEPEHQYRDGTERMATVQVRGNQWFFREMILASYGEKCAVCQLPFRQLLVASHIVPWSSDKSTRMNPRNGLCLCGTHDLAFERGVVTIHADYTIRVPARFSRHSESDSAREWIFRYDGAQIHPPERWAPEPVLLSRRMELYKAAPPKRELATRRAVEGQKEAGNIVRFSDAPRGRHRRWNLALLRPAGGSAFRRSVCPLAEA